MYLPSPVMVRVLLVVVAPNELITTFPEAEMVLVAVLVKVPFVNVKSPQVSAPEVPTAELAVSLVKAFAPALIAPPEPMVTTPKVFRNVPPTVAVWAPVSKRVSADPFKVIALNWQSPARVISWPAVRVNVSDKLR